MYKEFSSPVPEKCLGGGGPALPHTAPKGRCSLQKRPEGHPASTAPLSLLEQVRGHTGHTVRVSLVSPAQFLQPWAAAHQPTADKGNSPGLRVPSAPNQRGCACLPDLSACPFPIPACHSMSSRIKKNLKLLKYQYTLDLLPF